MRLVKKQSSIPQYFSSLSIGDTFVYEVHNKAIVHIKVSNGLSVCLTGASAGQQMEFRTDTMVVEKFYELHEVDE